MFKVQSLLVNKALWSTIQHIHVLFITMSSDTNIYIKQCHETNDHCANDKNMEFMVYISPLHLQRKNVQIIAIPSQPETIYMLFILLKLRNTLKKLQCLNEF